MEHDKEFGTAQEFTPLPDEYLQGEGAVLPESKGRRAVWKKRMYIAAALAIAAYVVSGAFASPTPPPADHPALIASEPSNAPTEQELPTEAETVPADQPETIPHYPVGDAMSLLTVYNDSFDPETGGNRILVQEYISESLLLQGDTYEMPAYEPVEGYRFMGWVVYYDKAAPLLSMLGNTLTAENVCYIKPEPDGGRNIEVHAVWRPDGDDNYPYLVELDANGGTIEDEDSIIYDMKGPMGSGAYIYLCAYPTPVREGYTFAGWYTKADGGDKMARLFGMDFYEKNGDEYDWQHIKTITLYAGWIKN